MCIRDSEQYRIEPKLLLQETCEREMLLQEWPDRPVDASVSGDTARLRHREL